MTKKLMLLIILVISVLSVIVIAVWGTLPENSNQIQVESITFENYELNDSNDKIINVIDIVTTDSPYVTLTYDYGPDDAYAIISASASSSDVTVLVDEIKQEVLVNFTTEDSIGKNVTITIRDTKTNKRDELTLIFKIPDIIIDD